MSDIPLHFHYLIESCYFLPLRLRSSSKLIHFIVAFFPTTNETFCLCSFTSKWCSLLLFVALPLSPQQGSPFELCEGNTEVTGTARTKSSAVSSLASIAEDLSVARLSSCSTASFQSNEPPVGVWCSADNKTHEKNFCQSMGTFSGEVDLSRGTTAWNR